MDFQCCDVRIADCLWQDMAIASICHVMVTVCLTECIYFRISDSRGCSDSRPLIVGNGDCLYLTPPFSHPRFSAVMCEGSYCSSLVIMFAFY